MKKVNDLKDENGTLVAKMKDLENERESCMERVKQLEKGNDKPRVLVFYVGNILVDKNTLCNGCFLTG
jgi:hypothetical protein